MRRGYAGTAVEASVPPFDASLVDFKCPPVVEVALGLQFSEPITSDARTLGRFWPTIQEEYPRLEQQPALPPQAEEFGSPQAPTFEFISAPPPPRHWFLNPAGDWLIQIQPDRIMFNWRKTRDDAEYPRYAELRPQLRAHVDGLLALPDGPDAKGVTPTWVEVTYVNQVLARPGEELPRLADILNIVVDPPEGAVVPPLEHTTLIQQYFVKDDETPVGRLHLTAQPGVRNVDQVPLYTITLVVRLRPAEPTLDEAFTALDRGRAILVQAFRDVTKPSMHEQWEIES